MKCFVSFVADCSKNQISEKRRKVFEKINGDIFYPIESWPRELRLHIWKKPLSNRNTVSNLFCSWWEMVVHHG